MARGRKAAPVEIDEETGATNGTDKVQVYITKAAREALTKARIQAQAKVGRELNFSEFMSIVAENFNPSVLDAPAAE